MQIRTSINFGNSHVAPCNPGPVQSQFRIFINDRDVSRDVAPLLHRLSVRDVAGAYLDTAEIQLDDTGGQFAMPSLGASSLRVELRGSRDTGTGLVFTGTIDGVRSEGGRSSGRLLTVSAKSADLLGPIKERQERHFDQVSIGDAFTTAARSVGLTAHIDQSLAALHREYLAMENESFLSFGQRLAQEIGATFKVAGGRAMLLKRSGGVTASGRELPAILAEYGQNLFDWSIEPICARSRHARTAVRHYDQGAAGWQTQGADTGVRGGTAALVGLHPAADADEAGVIAESLAGEVSRRAGGGEVLIDGNTSARPEAVCRLIGARPGIDGEYRIVSVEHTLDRSSGFTTRLELGQPQGRAGEDDRRPRQ